MSPESTETTPGTLTDEGTTNQDDARTKEPKVVTMRSAIKDAFQLVHARYENQYENRVMEPGLSTGFRAYDELTAGLQPGELTVLAGRPSMGCMALALNITANVVADTTKNVLIFSMSRAAREIALDLVALTGLIPRSRLNTGALHEEDWPRLSQAITRLSDKAIRFVDCPVLSCADMLRRARLLRQEGELGLIVVSRFHQLRADDFKRSIARGNLEIASTLKALAKELAVPVLALAHVKPSLDRQSDKHPSLYDLCECDAIAQYADTIACLYRDDYYNVDSKQPGVAEIIVEHPRSGSEGVAKLIFVRELMKFESYDPVRHPQDPALFKHDAT